jgi:hypothetical protein
MVAFGVDQYGKLRSKSDPWYRTVSGYLQVMAEGAGNAISGEPLQPSEGEIWRGSNRAIKADRAWV